MPLTKAICTGCGGPLEVDSAKEAAICPYCGTAYIVEKAVSLYQNTYNINADIVNIYSERDFEIKGGVLVKYNGVSVNVTIPDSVKMIRSEAFAQSAIESVSIPDSVEELPASAFQGCKYLKSVRMPDGVKAIPHHCFSGCAALSSISLPEGLREIGESAFNGCAALPSIRLPEGLRKIGGFAFNDCAALSSINLPEGLDEIGENAFEDCAALKQIKLPQGLSQIAKGTFSGCLSLTEIHIPDSVKSIREGAFSTCRSLKTITGAEYLETIGEYAFHHCDSLESFRVSESVQSIGLNAFRQCVGLKTIHIPRDADLKKLLPMPRKYHTSPDGEKKVISWEGGAFRGCKSLAEVDLYSLTEKSGKGKFMEKIMGDPYLITPGAEWLKLFIGTAFFRKAQMQNKHCAYCGGQFIGMFSKTCIDCGKPKDY